MAGWPIPKWRNQAASVNWTAPRKWDWACASSSRARWMACRSSHGPRCNTSGVWSNHHKQNERRLHRASAGIPTAYRLEGKIAAITQEARHMISKEEMTELFADMKKNAPWDTAKPLL